MVPCGSATLFTHHCTLSSGGRSLQSRAADASCPKSTRSSKAAPRKTSPYCHPCYQLMRGILAAVSCTHIWSTIFWHVKRKLICNSIRIGTIDILKTPMGSLLYKYFTSPLRSNHKLMSFPRYFQAQYLLVQPLQMPKQSLRCQWSVQNCLGRMAQHATTFPATSPSMLNRSWVTMVEVLECWTLHPWQILSASLPPVPPWKLSHKSSVLLPWRAPSRDQSALEFVTSTTPHAWKSFQYTCLVALSMIYVYSIHYMYTSDMYVYLCIYLRPKISGRHKPSRNYEFRFGELFRELFQSLNIAEIYQEALDVYDVYVLNSVWGAILANHSGHVAAVQPAPISRMRTKWLCQDPCEP